MQNRTRLMVGLWAFAFVGAASGQSLNVDLATSVERQGLGVPSPIFGGAAAQPGVWNVLDTSLDGPQGLDGLDGEPAGVSVFLQGPDFVSVNDDPGTSGDTALLLDDSLAGFGDVIGGVELTGLERGTYDVVVYGFAGGLPEELTFFQIEQASRVTGGPWSGAFVEGVTHATVRVLVDDASLSIGVAGGIWGQAGYFNGFQITLVGGPGCMADLNRDGILDNGDIQTFIAQFLDDWPGADLNGDGFNDHGDIAAFLEAFFQPC